MGIWKNIGKIISLSIEIIILWTKEQMKYITLRDNKQNEKIAIIPKKTHNEIKHRNYMGHPIPHSYTSTNEDT